MWFLGFNVPLTVQSLSGQSEVGGGGGGFQDLVNGKESVGTKQG